MQYWPSKSEVVIADYGLDWRPALSKLGDLTITGSTWSVYSTSEEETTLDLSASSINAGITGVRVSDGVTREELIIRNIVTLNNGERYKEDVFLKIL